MNERMSQEIKSCIAEVLGVCTDAITPELSIGDIPQWSSMTNIAIIAALEERFGIAIPQDDLFELTDVASLVAEVEKLKD